MRFLAVMLTVVIVNLVGPACAVEANDGEGEGESEGEGEGDVIDGPGAPGDICTFNADCQRALRCGCEEDAGCACEEGVRGDGQSGVDLCVDGNDCETSLCVEGQGDAFFCSGPCDDDGDCAAALPVCADIAFLGRVCVRAS
jgi:hypothetical protein